MEGNDLSAFITQITGALTEFSTSNLGTIIVAALGITVGIVMCWFAYRFISRKVMGAIKTGKG